MTLEQRETTPPPEKIDRPQVYEHLFPGAHWDLLPVFNPLSNAMKLVETFVATELESIKFGEAVEQRTGYARRIEIRSLDQLSLSFDLLDLQPIAENPQSIRGWISDLLKTGETLGGVTIRPVSWLKQSTRQDGVFSLTSTGLNDPDNIYDHSVMTVIGVLSADGKPAGIIHFRKGERPKKGHKEKESIFAPSRRILSQTSVTSS